MVKSKPQVPVLVLSVRASEGEKVLALDGGANDYVTKPFGIQEFLARVRVLKREVHRGLKCLKMDLKLQKIDPKTMKLTAFKKMKTASMWMSDDHERLPVRQEQEAVVVDVADIAGVEPALGIDG